jgi:alpha-D-xyloside xylohydrolase
VIVAAQLHLRERLRPYIHEQMRRAAETGLPPMRPLFVDFPEDPAAWEVSGQFLLGQAITADAPLDRIPVFTPYGSDILPLTCHQKRPEKRP